MQWQTVVRLSLPMVDEAFCRPWCPSRCFHPGPILLLMEAGLVFCSILNPIVTELEYNGGTRLPLVESRTNNDRLAAAGYGAVSCLKRRASTEIVRRRTTDHKAREPSCQRSRLSIRANVRQCHGGRLCAVTEWVVLGLHMRWPPVCRSRRKL